MDIQEFLSQAGVIIMTSILSVASAYAAIGVNKAINFLKQKTENDKIDKVFDSVETLVNKYVEATSSQINKGLQEAMVDGVVNVDELKAIANNVKGSVMSQIPSDKQMLLGQVMVSFEDYVQASVEAKLKDIEQKALQGLLK